jgi:hypothetical protein
LIDPEAVFRKSLPEAGTTALAPVSAITSSSVKSGDGVGAALQPMTTMVGSKANSKTMGRMFIGNILHGSELWTGIAGIYWVDD